MSRKPVWPYRIKKGHPSTKNLVGCFVVDNSGGQKIVYDLIYGNHGYIIGNSIVPIKTPDGVGLNFSGDGSSDRIDLGSIDIDNPLSCHINNEISIIAKVYFSSSSNNIFPRIADKSGGGTADGGYGAAIATTNLDRLEMYVDGVGTNGSFASTFSIPTNESILLGIRASSGNTAFNAGKNLSSTNNSTFTIPTTTNNMAIGNWNHASDRDWSGNQDIILIYDIKISDSLFFELENDSYHFIEEVRTLKRNAIYAAVFPLSSSDTVTFTVADNQLSGLSFSQVETVSHTISDTQLTGLNFSITEQTQYSLSENQLVGLGFSQIETVSYAIAENLLSGLNFDIGGTDTVTFTPAIDALIGLDFSQRTTTIFGIGENLLTGLSFSSSNISTFIVAENELVGVDFSIPGSDSVTFTVGENLLTGLDFTSVQSDRVTFTVGENLLTGISTSYSEISQFNISSNQLIGESFTQLESSVFNISINALVGTGFSSVNKVTSTVSDNQLQGLQFDLFETEYVFFDISENLLSGLQFDITQDIIEIIRDSINYPVFINRTKEQNVSITTKKNIKVEL